MKSRFALLNRSNGLTISRLPPTPGLKILSSLIGYCNALLTNFLPYALPLPSSLISTQCSLFHKTIIRLHCSAFWTEPSDGFPYNLESKSKFFLCLWKVCMIRTLPSPSQWPDPFSSHYPPPTRFHHTVLITVPWTYQACSASQCSHSLFP